MVDIEIKNLSQHVTLQHVEVPLLGDNKVVQEILPGCMAIMTIEPAEQMNKRGVKDVWLIEKKE